MAAYRLTMTFSSAGTSYVAGDVVELSEDEAAWMLRDVPGCIEAVAAGKPAAEPPAAGVPERDRMARAAGRARGK